ncbi:MAG: hypothetical protein GY920_10500 [Aliivibrio sp.]|nr:hypothetical protein [Aliivibrio sp.]
MNKDNLMFIGLAVVVVAVVSAGIYFSRIINSATLQTQIVKPKEGIECVVISAADSTSVDCWKTKE